MITLKEYDAKDWAKIDDAVEPFMLHESFIGYNMAIRWGLAVTAIEDGNVMACGGISNEGIVWVKVSKKCFAKPIKYAKGMMEVFKMMIDSLGPTKIITYVLKDFCKGERMAKMIGMKKTGSPYEFNGKIYNKFAVII